MSDPVTRSELLATLKAERRRLEALLERIGEARMTKPKAVGEWSVKDVVAHITTYELWLVDWLRSAQRGEFPSPSALDDPDIERRNARAHEEMQALSLVETVALARRTFQELVTAVEAFAEEDFIQPERTARFMEPYWSTFRHLGNAIANLSYEHYREHLPDLEAIQ